MHTYLVPPHLTFISNHWGGQERKWHSEEVQSFMFKARSCHTHWSSSRFSYIKLHQEQLIVGLDSLLHDGLCQALPVRLPLRLQRLPHLFLHLSQSWCSGFSLSLTPHLLQPAHGNKNHIGRKLQFDVLFCFFQNKMQRKKWQLLRLSPQISHFGFYPLFIPIFLCILGMNDCRKVWNYPWHAGWVQTKTRWNFHSHSFLLLLQFLPPLADLLRQTSLHLLFDVLPQLLLQNLRRNRRSCGWNTSSV